MISLVKKTQDTPDVRSIQNTLNTIQVESRATADVTSITFEEMRDDMENTNAKLQKELQESVKVGKEATVAANEAKKAAREATEVGRTASKAHIDRSIEQGSNEHIKNIKVVSSNQLKSGDLSIKTATAKDMETLREFTEDWIPRIGDGASMRRPTYGIVAHGIPTSSMDMDKLEDIRNEILLDNKPFILNAEIRHIGWLSRKSFQKAISSIIIEFTKPEDANKIIDEGLIWQGQVFQYDLYEKGSRLKQCFRCQKYGHIGTQCEATKACGYCAKDHNSRDFLTRTNDSIPRKCAVCQGTHVAWSHQCQTRKEEIAKVRAAYDTRPTHYSVRGEQDPRPGEPRITARDPGRPQEPRTARSRSPAKRGQKRANTGDTLTSGNKDNEPSTGSNAQRPIRIRTVSRRVLGDIANNSQPRLLNSQHIDLTTDMDS
ncbi:hypothetical protein DL767_001424 [Monosporascus sp. MG133]|nr:hypothetical protein DL767_001424 [Monosporascus sp. MG133]